MLLVFYSVLIFERYIVLSQQYKIYMLFVLSDRFFTGILSKSEVLSILGLELESMHE